MIPPSRCGRSAPHRADTAAANETNRTRGNHPRAPRRGWQRRGVTAARGRYHTAPPCACRRPPNVVLHPNQFTFHRILAALFCVLAFAPCVRAANEAALLELWNQHIATPEEHDETIKVCRAFVTANANDPLLPVVQGIEAWHHFRAGRTQDAWRILQPHLTAPVGPVTNAARALAQGWFTRLDREKAAASLQIYYRKEVAYPKTLDLIAKHPKIPAEVRPPFIDRFGQPWNYQLTGFAKTTGFPDQKYSLQSTALGDLSELKAAIAAPYASRIQAVPASRIQAVSAGIVPAPGNTVAVKFTKVGKAGTAIVAVGQATGDLHVAFAGTQIIVVCDHTHWKLFPSPK